MRNSNSKDKYSTSSTTQNQPNKLMKTQGPPKLPPKQQKQSLNSTQFKLSVSNKKIESSKNIIPSKPTPIQQRNFDIQKNMTQSKLFQAKQSLQLLKKKMNKTGMSRQKISTNNNITNSVSTNNQRNNNYSNQAPSMKKISSINSSKNIENYQPSNEYQQKIPPLYNKNKYQPNLNKTQPKKQIQKKTIIKKIEPPQQNYYNQHQQVPVSKNQDFFALLQKQMQKQANKNNNSLSNNNGKKNNIISNNQYDQDVQLIQCSKGCGRQFNPNSLLKHQKICQKVFQSKRKAFDIAAQRAIQTEGNYNKPIPSSNKHNQRNKQPQTKTNKIPKWKLQSAQLRAGLKSVNNVPLTKQEQQLTNMQKDSLVPCTYCGRKFNQQAAQKHIPFCQTKAKKSNINSRPSNTRKK